MASREEGIRAKIGAIHAALNQDNIASDIEYYHKELERLQTLLQSLENPEPAPLKTPSEYIEQYQDATDVLRSLQKQVAISNLTDATRVDLLSQIEFGQNWMQQLAAEFATIYPNENWSVEKDPKRLAIRDQLYELKRDERNLVHLIRLHQLSLERKPSEIAAQLLQKHQNELETLHQHQAKLQTLIR